MAREAPAKTRLVEAATELFGRNGFRDTAIDAIASEAGVSRSLVFWHFESKERLLWAVAAEAMRRWIATVKSATAGLRGLGALRRHIERRRTIITEDADALRLVHLLLGEAIGSGNDGAEALAELRESLEDARALFARWIAEAVEDGDLPANTDVAATADLAYATLSGIDWLRLVHGPTFDTDLADDAFLRLLTAPQT